MPVKVAVIVCNASLIPFFHVKVVQLLPVYTKEDGFYISDILRKKSVLGVIVKWCSVRTTPPVQTASVCYKAAERACNGRAR